MSQSNFEDLLTVELLGAMDFRHITLKLFKTLQLLPIDALPAHYPRDPAKAWHTLWLSPPTSGVYRTLEILPPQIANMPASPPAFSGSTLGSLLSSM
ncbi:hypothetical protein RMCBS344292_09987 [Rhizopus microsporus]|nr:hypothetical protein RMCBS344292_09987 [Rhizopus microsporus]